MTAGAVTRAAEPEMDGGAESRHGPVAQLLIAWSPLSAILVAYGVAEWVTGALGAGNATDRVFVGIAGYVVYPAAPPWLASERGEIGDVARISDVGWDVLHLDVVGRITEAGQSGSNPVAAMPSLHAGAALLVAMFLWPSVSRVARGALMAYAGAMALTLVYTGEHYVVDVLAGWTVAVLAILVATATRPDGYRRRRRPVRGQGEEVS